MGIVGMALGILVFLLVGSFLGVVMFHSAQIGFIPGIAAGLWTAWPFFHKGRVSRYNFLHPVPKEYKLTVPQAFAKIRDLLAELSYNFGDKWHVVTADPQAKRIVANLRFTEEETKFEAGRGSIQSRIERVQRFLELEVQLKATENDGAIVQLDFSSKVEGANIVACDSIISGFCKAIEDSIGPGVDNGSLVDNKLPAPPLWLLGITAFAVIVFLKDVLQLLFK